jgi:hypothetical protein
MVAELKFEGVLPRNFQNRTTLLSEPDIQEVESLI